MQHTEHDDSETFKEPLQKAASTEVQSELALLAALARKKAGRDRQKGRQAGWLLGRTEHDEEDEDEDEDTR